jgi:Fuc2NAc and GlcNAc transferase
MNNDRISLQCTRIDVLYLGLLTLAILSVTYVGLSRYLVFASKHQLLDQPNRRSLHKRPVVQGAGIIMALVWCGFLLVEALVGELPLYYVQLFFPGLMILSCLGYIDDLYDLSPYTRLCVQTLVAMYVVFCLQGISDYEFAVYTVHLGWFGSWVAVVSIVWSINLFNFMDGADGFGCCQGVYIFLFAFVLLVLLKQWVLAKLMLLFLTPLLVFSFFNLPPARCFMGDSGAYCLGFLIVTSALLTQATHQISILTWGCFYAFFALDTLVTLIRRLVKRVSIFQPHQEFLHHKVILGLGFKPVVLLVLLFVFNGFVAWEVFTSIDPAHISLHRALVVFIFWSILYALIHFQLRRKYS